MSEYYSKFPFGANVSFQVYPSQILGAEFKNVRVDGIIDYATAQLLKLDTAAVHAQVYSSLPTGTPNDHRQYQYLKLTHPNGAVQCIGIPWIKLDTVAVVLSTAISIRVLQAVPGDVEKLRQVLAYAGFNHFEIKVE